MGAAAAAWLRSCAGLAAGSGLLGAAEALVNPAPANLMPGFRLTGALFRRRLPLPPEPLPQRPHRMALGALALEEEEAPRGRPLRTTPDRLSMAHTHSCSSSWPGGGEGSNEPDGRSNAVA